MENRDFTRCRFCHVYFRPQRQKVSGKKKIEYIECPRCGNGYIQKSRKWKSGVTIIGDA